MARRHIGKLSKANCADDFQHLPTSSISEDVIEPMMRVWCSEVRKQTNKHHKYPIEDKHHIVNHSEVRDVGLYLKTS